MITWSGRLRKRVGEWRYDVYYNFKCSYLQPQHPLGFGPLCHTDSMFRSLYNYRDDINTWGYSAPSTNQMALALLGWSLCRFGYETLFYRLMDRLDNEPDIQALRDTILKCHRAFANEVVSELPDNWTMTSEDILVWLNKKEKEEFQLNAAT